MEYLRGKIEQKTAKVGIIGLGYVGLPLAVEVAVKGYGVIGFDVDERKVKSVNDGNNYIKDVDDKILISMVEKGSLKASSDFTQLKLCDIIIICVPTPIDVHLEPDVTFIREATAKIAQNKGNKTLIILESTTYPGTTEEVVKPIIDKTKAKIGEDYFLCFSPERVDPGNKDYKTGNTPKVVGGCTAMCTELGEAFYRSIISGGVFPVSSPKIAEMEKLLENIFRLVNIGLINEMALLCDRMGIDIWEVVDAAKTKPYGFMPFYPGPGPGGHCIPIDPYYLAWKAKEFNFNTSIIEVSGAINHKMPEFVVEKSARILNRHKKCLNGSKIVMLGIAYKKDIADYRESPALVILDILRKEGAVVSVVDPYVDVFFNHNGDQFKSVPLTAELLKNSDLVVLATDHTDFDKEFIIKNSPVIYDTRNFFKTKNAKIIKL